MVFLLTAVVAHAQTTRTILSACEVVKNPNRYHKKVIYMDAIMNAHAESRALWPARGCSGSEEIAFTTDEDFKEVNDPNIRDEFWVALDPVTAIQKERPSASFSMKYCCVLRTPIIVKGYFIVSDKRESDRFKTPKLTIYIRQIMGIGKPRLIDVSSKEYFSR